MLSYSSENKFKLKHIKKEKGSVFGKHYIMELKTNNRKLLDDGKAVMRIMEEAARKGNVTVLGSLSRDFEPQGFTGVLLLSESHITIHTWPEYGYAAIDVFTCGGCAEVVLDHMAKELEASDFELVFIERGAIDED
ncbi:MAG: adenosylmethionine decarboxylase [Methanobacteriota archaeon]|nr:MAG: adenosylmethionine decarboxylase [Euryarchaeota archaeon]